MGGLDFAGLAALSGVDSWAEKRADRNADLQRVAIMNAMAEQDNQKKQAEQAEIQQYLNTVSQIKVLDQDKAKIADKEKEYRGAIQEGIKKAHGNIDEWLNTGGKTDLMKYQSNIVNDKATQQGLMNALNHNLYMAEQQKGLTPRDVNVGGKMMSYPEQYQQFKEGKIDQLNYGGGYEEPIGNPAKDFATRFGNEEGRPQTASAQHVYDYWLNTPKGKGMNEHDRMQFAKQKATEYATQFGSHGENGGYPFKALTPEQADYSRRNAIKEIQANERLKLAQEKVNNGQGGDPFGIIHSGAVGKPEKFSPNAYAYMDIFGQTPQAGTPEDQTVEVETHYTPLAEKSKASEATYMGLKYDKQVDDKTGGYVGRVENADKIISPTTFQKALGNINDMPGVVIKDLEGVRTIIGPDGKPTPYTLVIIKFKNQRQMDDFGAINHHYAWASSEKGAWQGDVDWNKKEVTALVPITNPAENPLGHRQWNTEMKRYGQIPVDNDPYLEESKDGE